MRTIQILLLTLGLCPFTVAQSFECKLAKSPREHTVCSDQKLAALDSAVSAAYKSLRAQLSPESAALVQSDQREWLHWLDAVCPAHGEGIAGAMNFCLWDKYKSREHDLEQVVHIGSMVIFPRSHFVYKGGNPDEERGGDNDPGFGYGSLSWPQIDIQPSRPHPAYTEWNSAVKMKAAKPTLGISHKDYATFETAVDASGTVDGFYTVEAANDRLIDVSLFDMSYSWGSAHPNTDRTSFLWWLDRNRELTISDVFIAHSDWQDKLTALAVSNLRAQSGLKDDILREGLEEVVNETVSNLTTWTPTREGLTITFGQYSIGPYAIDMPEAYIPWSDLKPYLAPDLQPTTLPAPTPKPNR